MISARGRLVSNTVSPSLRRVNRELAKVPKQAFKVFKDNTPVDKGNAKRNTKLKGQTIHADYAYAKVLDKGRHMTSRGARGSNQAPSGMTEPTIKFLERRLKQIFKRG